MTDAAKTVSVVGLGKLGACLAAELASKGMEVIGVDIRQEETLAVPAKWLGRERLAALGKTQGDVLMDHRWQVMDAAMLAGQP